MRRTIALAALSTLLLAVGIGAAAAQSDTTVPPQTTTTGGPTSQTIPHGTANPFVAESCGFSDGVALQLNGSDAGSDTVGTDGCTRQNVSWTNGGTAAGSARFAVVGVELAQTGTPKVTIDGRTYNGVIGNNTLAVFGVGTNGANRTVFHTFTITSASGGGGALPRTGAMILRWSLAALALLAVGGLLVLADRRRRVVPIRDDRTPRV